MLYPHLFGFYSFLDHSSFSLEGGVGSLLILVKGLASCGVPNKTIALFDNDTAGRNAASAAIQLQLPSNFRICQLPKLQYGVNYPTLGPTGLTSVDINGTACSIELYLGLRSLTGADGKLTPVQWKGYDQKLKQYQGELLNKYEVQERFLQHLKVSSCPQTDAEFDAVRMVLQTVFNAFR